MANNILNTLYQSAGNFIYIFADHKMKGWQQIVINKKAEQISELTRLYQYDRDNNSLTTYINVIRKGIKDRYGKQPEQVLAELISISNRNATIGAMTDAQVANKIDNYTTSINKNGKWYKSKKFWDDLATILEKVLNFFLKLFGNYKDPNIFAPSNSDWKGNNRPEFSNDTPYETKQSSIPILPIMLLAGAYLYTKK